MNNIKEEIKNFIKSHSTVLKWILFLVSLLLMLMAIQIYMNYITIIENTENIKKQNSKVQEEIDYINNYQLKYLDSNHAKTFLSHENNILKE
jgi:cell division protein FtsL